MLLRVQVVPLRRGSRRKEIPWLMWRGRGHHCTQQGLQGPGSPIAVGESPHLVLCREAGHGGGPGLAFHGEVVLAV